MREKLIELLTDDYCPIIYMQGEVGNLADYLIKQGVTVQEWISVKDERKPKAGEDVLVVVFDGYDTYTDTDCLMRDGKWCFETENHKVTHWQPMPQPPKGE